MIMNTTRTTVATISENKREIGVIRETTKKTIQPSLAMVLTPELQFQGARDAIMRETSHSILDNI